MCENPKAVANKFLPTVYINFLSVLYFFVKNVFFFKYGMWQKYELELTRLTKLKLY